MTRVVNSKLSFVGRGYTNARGSLMQEMQSNQNAEFWFIVVHLSTISDIVWHYSGSEWMQLAKSRFKTRCLDPPAKCLRRGWSKAVFFCLSPRLFWTADCNPLSTVSSVLTNAKVRCPLWQVCGWVLLTMSVQVIFQEVHFYKAQKLRTEKLFRRRRGQWRKRGRRRV